MLKLKRKIFLLIICLVFTSIILNACNKQVEETPKIIQTLPQPLVEYLATIECGNAVCEIGENSANCLKDCSKAKLSSKKWTQVNGPYGGWITDLEKVGNTLWTSTSFTHSLGGNGIFEIKNQGLDWKAIGGTNNSAIDVAVNSNDTKNIVFITQDSFFITNNGGSNWQKIALNADLYTSVTISSANPSLIFVGAVLDEEVLLFVSQNGGKNWTKTLPLPQTEWSVKPIWAGFPEEAANWITVIEPHPTNENILFVGTNSALFKSEDQGLNWKRIDTTFHRTDILDVKINSHDTNEVYARVGVFEDSICMETASRENSDWQEIEKENCAGIYKSNDLGKTWKQMDAYYFDPSEGGVFIDDKNSSIVYSIFSRKILRTEDNGKTWEEFFWTHNEPFIANSGIERLEVGDNSKEIFIAGRQGLFYTKDNSEHWHERNNGFIGSEVVDIIKASDGTLYAGTYTQGMFKSTDKGQSWTFSSYNLENPYIMLIATHPTEPQTIFVTTNGGVYASNDSGLTWNPIAKEFFSNSEILPGISHYHGIAIDPKNPNRIYVGGGGDQYSPSGAGISISEDGGKNWKQTNIGFEIDVHVSKIVIDKNNPSIVYATTQGPTDFSDKIGNGFGVFKSIDYGQKWEKINNGLETLETNTLTLDPNDSNVLYLGTDNEGIYKSNNSGASWNKLNIYQLSEKYGIGDIIVDPQNSSIIYAATVDYFRLFNSRGLIGDYGVYISEDGGVNWQPFNEGLQHAGAFALELDNENRILYVGTRGGGIYWRSV